MATVIHLLPYDGIGGAEAAARSMLDGPPLPFDFALAYVFTGVRSRQDRARTFNPFALLACVRRILARKPDLLIVSLWRACLVGILVRLLRPRTRLVVLIHNSVDAHAVDFIATRIAMKLARAVWADSQASLDRRFRRLPLDKTTVIPFLARHLAPARDDAPATPQFVFWGRLAAQKNLLRALGLFRSILASQPAAAFTIIGPDAGQRAMLERTCREWGISEAVAFVGPLPADAIRERAGEAAFYLQTSDYEGMAMAVVEAMQWGLVPVVAPVGEIATYCRDGDNAILVDAADAATARVLALIEDPVAYRRMRAAALATWRDKPLYRDAVRAQCLALLGVSTPLPSVGLDHQD